MIDSGLHDVDHPRYSMWPEHWCTNRIPTVPDVNAGVNIEYPRFIECINELSWPAVEIVI